MARQEILAAAQYYIDYGMPVIPLCPADEETHAKMSPGHQSKCNASRHGKLPLIAGWQNKSETTREELEQWAEQFKDFNLGLPMGSASGYVGIDIDGAEGEGLLSEMSNGELPPTWEYSTGAGRRLIYRIPVGLRTKKFKQTGESVHSECAFLCTGQQTVIPPSIHKSGTIYTWSQDCHPQSMDCADAPVWLVDLIKEERKAPMMLDLSGSKLGEVANIENMNDEFTSSEFDVYLPPELLEMQSVEVKRKKHVGKEEKESSVELYTTISEGARDDTMVRVIGAMLAKPEYRMMPKEMFMTLMLSYNQTYCDPPLDDETIKIKVNHLHEIEMQKDANYKDFSGKKDFQGTQCAQIIRNLMKEQMNTLIEYEVRSKTFYTCNANRGPWKQRTGGYEEVLTAIIRRYIEDPKYGDASWGKDYYIKEVVSSLKSLLLLDSSKDDISFDLASNVDLLTKYIIVDGKLFDWKSGDLRPWDPQARVTHSFDIGYNPEAKCPHWKQYMKDWVPDDKSRDFLQEFFGYALIPDMSIPMILFLEGPGSNGKSVFLECMQKFIFKDIYSTLSTTQLCSKFGTSPIKGKLINLCEEDEGEKGYIKNPEKLKALSGGSNITIENKGKDPYEISNRAKLVFSTNNTPKSKDKSHGWNRRFVIIRFPNRFESDMALKDRMLLNMQHEAPGIFNWLIEGLRRVKARGHFLMEGELAKSKEAYRAKNDPLDGFIHDCIDIVTCKDPEELQGKRKGIPTKHMEALYSIWCQFAYGDKASNYMKTKRAFMEGLTSRGLVKSTGYDIIGPAHGKLQCFLGLKIKITDYDLYTFILEAARDEGAMSPEGEIAMFIKTFSKVELEDIEEEYTN